MDDQPPDPPDAPAGPKLVDQLRFMARRFPDEPAYRNLDAGTTLTCREWNERSNQLARWLIDRGVEKHDGVAIYIDSDHCLQWITTYAAVDMAGGVMAAVRP